MTDEKKPDDEAGVALQPSLPTTDLPEFEGLRPIGVLCKVNGAGSRIHRAMHLEEKVILVIETEVANVGHALTDDGVKRVHTLRVKDLFELEGKPGAALLRSLRQAYRLADDARHGRTALGGIADSVDSAGPGLEVTVDGNGTVVTNAEKAAKNGELLEGLPHVDVAVLVFEDGGRALWPDDFADAVGPHPEAGERIARPGAKKDADPELVRKVLDADTGETVEEWTDEQEDERLRELEESLGREEARQDREAAEELEAARAAAQGTEEPPLPGEEELDGMHPRFKAREVLAGNVAQTKKAIVGVDDVAVVRAALELETGGKSRAGVLTALRGRLEVLES